MRSLLLIILVSAGAFPVFAQQTSVDVDTFEKRMNGEPGQVLDVRTAEEFKTGHLKNAFQANWNNREEFTTRIAHLDKQKPVYIYCLAGSRSADAAKWLRSNGFEHVVEMNGGINAWKQANKPVTGESNKPELGVEEFRKQVEANTLVLVDVGAAWCPPCKKMEPVIQAFLQEHDEVKLVMVDGGKDRTIMKRLGANVLPTLILYKDGREQWRKEGITSREELDRALSALR
jgi:rhodanese-related sulfurtransferase